MVAKRTKLRNNATRALRARPANNFKRPQSARSILRTPNPNLGRPQSAGGRRLSFRRPISSSTNIAPRKSNNWANEQAATNQAVQRVNNPMYMSTVKNNAITNQRLANAQRQMQYYIAQAMARGSSYSLNNVIKTFNNQTKNNQTKNIPRSILVRIYNEIMAFIRRSFIPQNNQY
jgi:hypothetical protein